MVTFTYNEEYGDKARLDELRKFKAHQLSNLERINVSGEAPFRCTSAGWAEIKRAFPNCYIELTDEESKAVEADKAEAAEAARVNGEKKEKAAKAKTAKAKKAKGKKGKGKKKGGKKTTAKQKAAKAKAADIAEGGTALIEGLKGLSTDPDVMAGVDVDECKKNLAEALNQEVGE